MFKELNQRRPLALALLVFHLVYLKTEQTPWPPHSLSSLITLQHNVIPVEWKKAKVTPLHKSGAMEDPKNYRPISVLPVVSKVLGRLTHRQPACYFDEHNLLCIPQSGFKRKHSTETAVIYFTDDILTKMDKGVVTAYVFTFIIPLLHHFTI